MRSALLVAGRKALAAIVAASIVAAPGAGCCEAVAAEFFAARAPADSQRPAAERRGSTPGGSVPASRLQDVPIPALLPATEGSAATAAAASGHDAAGGQPEAAERPVQSAPDPAGQARPGGDADAQAWQQAGRPFEHGRLGGQAEAAVELQADGDGGRAPSGPALPPAGEEARPPSASQPPKPAQGPVSGPGKRWTAGRVALVSGVVVAAAVAAGLVFFPSAPVISSLGHLLLPKLYENAYQVMAMHSQHGLAAASLLVASKACYLWSNIAGFIFPIPQLHHIYKTRSANVSVTTIVIGVVGSTLLAVTFGHLGVAFASYQNAFGALAFGAILVQKAWLWYQRRGGRDLPPARFSPMAKTIGTVAILDALTWAAGRGLVHGLPLLPMKSLLVPLQSLAVLAFAGLLLPEYMKIVREKSVGDADRSMAKQYLGAMATGGYWVLYQIATMPTTYALMHFVPVAVLAGFMAAAAYAVFRWLGRRQLRAGPSLLIFSAVLLAAVAAGYGDLRSLLEPAHNDVFWAYLFYLAENVFAFVVTALALRAFTEYGSDGGGHPPPDAPPAGPAAGPARAHSS